MYFDLDVTLILMCDLDLINDLYQHTNEQYVEISKIRFSSYDLDLDLNGLDTVKMYLYTKNGVHM